MRIDRVVDYDFLNHEHVSVFYFVTFERNENKGFLITVDCSYPESLYKGLRNQELDLVPEKFEPHSIPEITTSSYYNDPKEFARNKQNWIDEPENAYPSENIKPDKVLRWALTKVSKEIIQEIF